MITDSPHKYRRLGKQLGHDPELLTRAATWAALVESQGLASVLTLKHLAHQSGASYAYLRKIIQRKSDPYTEIHRKRRNGTPMRVISAPDPPLMAVQRWILRRIAQYLRVHPASCAYMPGNSIVKCASAHLGATWLMKMDVHDFFHSIDERRVYSLFESVGYGPLVSLELARLCTRGTLGPRLDSASLKEYVISSYRTLTLGALPQGAPTSGALANAIMYDCDVELSALASSYDLVYTRYADDITFSASGDFMRADAIKVVRLATEVLMRNDLMPHAGKTRIAPPGSRRIVLGLLVDGDSLRLPRATRRRLADHIRGVKTFGLKDHSAHRNFTSTFGFMNHVNGIIAFAHDVEPEWADNVAREWNEVLTTQGLRTSKY